MSEFFVGPSVIALAGRPVDWGLQIRNDWEEFEPKMLIEFFEDFLEPLNIGLGEFLSSAWEEVGSTKEVF